MLIDTHCHLDAPQFAEDYALILAKAREQGVRKIVVPAVCQAHFAAVQNLCEQFSQCLPAYGIHPLFTQNVTAENLATMRVFLQQKLAETYAKANAKTPKIVAIGEIGLDFFVPNFDENTQQTVFRAQLKMARDFALPVLLHVRRAQDAVLKNLRQLGVKKGIAHAFNGSFQQAENFIKQGFLLGFGGAMTYPNATQIRALATKLPLEHLVLETDAPDIPPAWIAKKRNSPEELRQIAQTLAQLRGISLEEVATITSANVLKMFNIL